MPQSDVQKDFYLFPVNNVYYAQFRDPVTRKLLSKRSSGLRNRTKAEKWALNEFDRMRGEAGKTGLAFGEYAEPFYTEECPHEAARKAEGQSCGVKTRIDNRFRLKNYIMTDEIALKRLCGIARPDCLGFRDRLINKLGYTRKAALTLTAFKNIMHAALSRGLINGDPTVKVNIKAKTKKRAAADVEGVKNILLKKYWLTAAFWRPAVTAGLAGLRAGELCGLRWRDIVVEREEIRVACSMNKYEGEKPPKSGKPRVAAYPKLLQRILEPHRGGPDEYAFSIREGRPMSLNSISGAMKRAVGSAVKDGIKKRKEAAGDTTEVTEEEIEKEKSAKRITLHGLRHSINTALLEAGVNPELLRASFGWADAATQEIYTHRELYNLAPQREAAEKLFGGFTGE